MARYLIEASEFIDHGYFTGRLYRIGQYPGAVPSSLPTDQVLGEIYRLSDPEPTLATLDQYEEFGPAFPEPNEFRREVQTIGLNSGGSIEAWIYLYNRSIDPLCRIETFQTL